MSAVLSAVQDINKELFAPKNDVAGKSAFEVVAMAAATGTQNQMAMHASFETTSNTVLNVAMQKLAEATGKNDAPAVAAWTTLIATVTTARESEVASFEKFNTMTKSLVENFPKGGG